ncbi:hypothetical protein QBC47DRAFT_182039 [Echria macrotheca]|uniref:Uncharacterized protein n=1 Tax=Echria macrotheca TaxID=438768 RepID=A0AAJ0BFA7_9PEZI|nr:hypothetical protein QBC47DRAFT_182039 [Echria macrotheca]
MSGHAIPIPPPAPAYPGHQAQANRAPTQPANASQGQQHLQQQHQQQQWQQQQWQQQQRQQPQGQQPQGQQLQGQQPQWQQPQWQQQRPSREVNQYAPETTATKFTDQNRFVTTVDTRVEKLPNPKKARDDLCIYTVRRYEDLTRLDTTDDDSDSDEELGRIDSWKHFDVISVQGVQQHEAAKQVRLLNKYTGSVTEKKKMLSPELVKHLEFASHEISKSFDPEFFETNLVQLDYQLRVSRKEKRGRHRKDGHRDYKSRDNKKRGRNETTSRLFHGKSKDWRRQAKYKKGWESKVRLDRSSITAYYKTSPLPNVNVVELWRQQNLRKLYPQMQYQQEQPFYDGQRQAANYQQSQGFIQLPAQGAQNWQHANGYAEQNTQGGYPPAHGGGHGGHGNPGGGGHGGGHGGGGGGGGGHVGGNVQSVHGNHGNPGGNGGHASHAHNQGGPPNAQRPQQPAARPVADNNQNRRDSVQREPNRRESIQRESNQNNANRRDSSQRERSASRPPTNRAASQSRPRQGGPGQRQQTRIPSQDSSPLSRHSQLFDEADISSTASTVSRDSLDRARMYPPRVPRAPFPAVPFEPGHFGEGPGPRRHRLDDHPVGGLMGGGLDIFAREELEEYRRREKRRREQELEDDVLRRRLSSPLGLETPMRFLRFEDEEDDWADGERDRDWDRGRDRRRMPVLLRVGSRRGSGLERSDFADRRVYSDMEREREFSGLRDYERGLSRERIPRHVPPHQVRHVSRPAGGRFYDGDSDLGEDYARDRRPSGSAPRPGLGIRRTSPVPGERIGGRPGLGPQGQRPSAGVEAGRYRARCEDFFE